MITNEIIKALDCCRFNISPCSDCPLHGTKNCRDELIILAFDLIRCQQEEKEALIAGHETLQKYIAEKNAEIEQWKEEAIRYQDLWCDAEKDILKARVEAYKEFAERLKEKLHKLDRFVVYNEDIDNLVKELTEVKDDD